MGGGIGISIEGLEELGADLSKLERNGLREAIRRSMRGPGGEAIAAEMRLRSPRKSGYLVRNIRVSGEGRDDTLVGYQGEIDGRGTFIESGAPPHTIRAKDGGSMYFGGRYVEEVQHPGFRGKKVASRSIRASEWEVLADIVDQIDGMIGGH